MTRVYVVIREELDIDNCTETKILGVFSTPNKADVSIDIAKTSDLTPDHMKEYVDFKMIAFDIDV